MKKSILSVFILLFLIFAGNVIAAPISVKVISSSFHVWGFYSTSYESNDPALYPSFSASDSYDKTGTAPLSGSVERPDIIGYWGGPAWARSAADLFGVSVDSGSYWGGYANAFAQVDATFRPVNDFNTINFLGNGPLAWFLFKGYLIDLTDNVVIWHPESGTDAMKDSDPFYQDMDTGGIPYILGSGTINYVFESDHIYSMHLYEWSNAADDSTDASFSFPDLVAAPEPATMLLLGLGLIGVAWVRRKFQK